MVYFSHVKFKQPKSSLYPKKIKFLPSSLPETKSLITSISTLLNSAPGLDNFADEHLLRMIRRKISRNKYLYRMIFHFNCISIFNYTTSKIFKSLFVAKLNSILLFSPHSFFNLYPHLKFWIWGDEKVLFLVNIVEVFFFFAISKIRFCSMNKFKTSNTIIILVPKN